MAKRKLGFFTVTMRRHIHRSGFVNFRPIKKYPRSRTRMINFFPFSRDENLRVKDNDFGCGGNRKRTRQYNSKHRNSSKGRKKKRRPDRDRLDTVRQRVFRSKDVFNQRVSRFVRLLEKGIAVRLEFFVRRETAFWRPTNTILTVMCGARALNYCNNFLFVIVEKSPGRPRTRQSREPPRSPDTGDFSRN